MGAMRQDSSSGRVRGAQEAKASIIKMSCPKSGLDSWYCPLCTPATIFLATWNSQYVTTAYDRSATLSGHVTVQRMRSLAMKNSELKMAVTMSSMLLYLGQDVTDASQGILICKGLASSLDAACMTYGAQTHTASGSCTLPKVWLMSLVSCGCKQHNLSSWQS